MTFAIIALNLFVIGFSVRGLVKVHRESQQNKLEQATPKKALESKSSERSKSSVTVRSWDTFLQLVNALNKHTHYPYLFDRHRLHEEPLTLLQSREQNYPFFSGNKERNKVNDVLGPNSQFNKYAEFFSSEETLSGCKVPSMTALNINGIDLLVVSHGNRSNKKLVEMTSYFGVYCPLPLNFETYKDTIAKLYSTYMKVEDLRKDLSEYESKRGDEANDEIVHALQSKIEEGKARCQVLADELRSGVVEYKTEEELELFEKALMTSFDD